MMNSDKVIMYKGSGISLDIVSVSENYDIPDISLSMLSDQEIALEMSDTLRHNSDSELKPSLRRKSKYKK